MEHDPLPPLDVTTEKPWTPVSPPPLPPLALLGARFGARLIDAALVWLLTTAFTMIASPLLWDSLGGSLAFGGSRMGLGLLGYGIQVAYEGVMLARFGATLGKMALKIHVVPADFTPLSLGTAFARAGGALLSSLLCGIGHLVALFHPQRQSLSDLIANTYVVQGPSPLTAWMGGAAPPNGKGM
jgi:uncharacterized RDD family membrane protein YckC